MDQRPSFYFFDLETSGIDPRWHRTMQFAGIRTDERLNEVEPYESFYIHLPIDVLPDPGSCLVTGLTPQRVNRDGVGELEAHVRIHRHLSLPGTCGVGFNNLRFDDEFLRYGFFRNFIDPYAREWQGGNSRWDLIDLVRAAGALRPEGLEWPMEDGLPSFRLEALTTANGIEHEAAHDAASDVRATLAMARLVRRAQPKLFDYYLGLRKKSAVADLLLSASPQVRVHVSGMLGRERHCIAPIVPVVRHPNNANSVVVVDLARDVTPLIEWDVDRLREALFTAGSQIRPPLKEIRLNRCPFVAPTSVLRDVDRRRLDIDLEEAEQRLDRLRRVRDLPEKIRGVYAGDRQRSEDDVDASLYRGFLNDADRGRCADVLSRLLAGEPVAAMDFEDQRLPELLWRARARRSLLSDDTELTEWKDDIRARLHRSDWGGVSIEAFRRAIDELPPEAATLSIDLSAHLRVVEAFIAA